MGCTIDVGITPVDPITGPRRDERRLSLDCVAEDETVGRTITGGICPVEAADEDGG